MVSVSQFAGYGSFDRQVQEFRRAADALADILRGILAEVAGGRVPEPEGKARFDAGMDELQGQYLKLHEAASALLGKQEEIPFGSSVNDLEQAVRAQQEQVGRELGEAEDTLRAFLAVQGTLPVHLAALQTWRARACLLWERLSDFALDREALRERLTPFAIFLKTMDMEDSPEKEELFQYIDTIFRNPVSRYLFAGKYRQGETADLGLDEALRSVPAEVLDGERLAQETLPAAGTPGAEGPAAEAISEQPTEATPAQPSGQTAAVISEQPSEATPEQPSGQPAEAISEQPSEAMSEQSAEQPSEAMPGQAPEEASGQETAPRADGTVGDDSPAADGAAGTDVRQQDGEICGKETGEEAACGTDRAVEESIEEEDCDHFRGILLPEDMYGEEVSLRARSSMITSMAAALRGAKDDRMSVLMLFRTIGPMTEEHLFRFGSMYRPGIRQPKKLASQLRVLLAKGCLRKLSLAGREMLFMPYEFYGFFRSTEESGRLKARMIPGPIDGPMSLPQGVLSYLLDINDACLRLFHGSKSVGPFGLTPRERRSVWVAWRDSEPVCRLALPWEARTRFCPPADSGWLFVPEPGALLPDLSLKTRGLYLAWYDNTLVCWQDGHWQDEEGKALPAGCVEAPGELLVVRDPAAKEDDPEEPADRAGEEAAVSPETAEDDPAADGSGEATEEKATDGLQPDPENGAAAQQPEQPETSAGSAALAADGSDPEPADGAQEAQPSAPADARRDAIPPAAASTAEASPGGSGEDAVAAEETEEVSPVADSIEERRGGDLHGLLLPEDMYGKEYELLVVSVSPQNIGQPEEAELLSFLSRFSLVTEKQFLQLRSLVHPARPTQKKTLAQLRRHIDLGHVRKLKLSRDVISSPLLSRPFFDRLCAELKEVLPSPLQLSEGVIAHVLALNEALVRYLHELKTARRRFAGPAARSVELVAWWRTSLLEWHGESLACRIALPWEARNQYCPAADMAWLFVPRPGTLLPDLSLKTRGRYFAWYNKALVAWQDGHWQDEEGQAVPADLVEAQASAGHAARRPRRPAPDGEAAAEANGPELQAAAADTIAATDSTPTAAAGSIDATDSTAAAGSIAATDSAAAVGTIAATDSTPAAATGKAAPDSRRRLSRKKAAPAGTEKAAAAAARAETAAESDGEGDRAEAAATPKAGRPKARGRSTARGKAAGATEAAGQAERIAEDRAGTGSAATAAADVSDADATAAADVSAADATAAADVSAADAATGADPVSCAATALRLAGASSLPGDEEFLRLIVRLLDSGVTDGDRPGDAPESRLAQALMLARAAAGKGESLPGCARLYEQLMLAMGVHSEDHGNVGDRLNALFAENDPDRQSLLLAACMLALFAHAERDYTLQKQAENLLGQYETYFPAYPALKALFSRLCKIADVDPRGFTQANLAQIEDKEEKVVSMRALQKRAKDLLGEPVISSYLRGIPQLLTDLFGSRSDIQACLEIVVRNRIEERETVEVLLHDYCEQKAGSWRPVDKRLDEAIDRGWAEASRNESTRRITLMGLVRRRLVEALKDRLEIMVQWLESSASMDSGQVDKLRKLRNAILKELDAIAPGNPTDPAPCAIVLAHALGHMRALLGGHDVGHLFADALRTGYVSLDEKFQPAFEAGLDDILYYESWRRVLLHIAHPEISLAMAEESISDAHSHMFDNLHQQHLLARLGYGEDSEHGTLEKAEKRARELTGRFEEELELDYTAGRLTEQDKETLLQHIGSHQGDFFAVGDFGCWKQFLDALRLQRNDGMAAIEADLRKDIALRTRDGVLSADLKKVEDCLEQGQFALAEEYINQADVRATGNGDPADGDGLAADDQVLARKGSSFLDGMDLFARFLSPEVFDQLYDFANRLKGTNFSRNALDFVQKHCPEGWSSHHREDSRSFLKSWPTRRSSTAAQDIRGLMEGLGFTVTGASKLRNKAEEVFELKVEGTPRGFSDYPHPISDFGTRLRSPLMVVVLYGSKQARELVDTIHSLRPSRNGQTIVVLDYFLSRSARCQLAELCHQSSGEIPFIVIDRVLALHLALHQRTERMCVLLACTLPYATAIQPFVRDGGQTADEMFCGRTRELADILNLGGASLVYGGRQLGKTALLQRAQSVFHNPSSRNFAVFCDIRSLEKEEDLVACLVENVNKVSLGLPACTSLKEFCDHIDRRFLEGRIQSMLLLMDEADAFLQAISAGQYEVLQPLVALRRSREFKFVLAGLNNVYRVGKATANNSVFGQLGQPLCIKPLSPVDAMHLLLRPLHYLGFTSATSSGLEPILSSTNYYPGIIQFLGYSLVQTINDRYTRYYKASTNNPPFPLKGELLGSIMSSEDLKTSIRDKFFLSLRIDKDNRYLMLARCIGLLYLYGVPMKDGFKGYQTSQIEKMAGAYDIHCLTGLTGRDYEGLLDEMAEMGILHRFEPGVYRFRKRSFRDIVGSDVDRLEIEIQQENSEGNL